MFAPTTRMSRGTQTAEAMSSANPFAPAHALDSAGQDEQSDTWSFVSLSSHVPKSKGLQGLEASEQQLRPSAPIDTGLSEEFPRGSSHEIADLEAKVRALRTSQKNFMQSLSRVSDALEDREFESCSRHTLLTFVVGIYTQRFLDPLQRAEVDEERRDRAAIRFLDAWGSLDDRILDELQSAVESAVSKQSSEKRSECNHSRRRFSEKFAPRQSVLHGALGATTEDHPPGTAGQRSGVPLEGDPRRPKGQRSAEKRSAKEGTRKPTHTTSPTHSSERRRRASGKDEPAYNIRQQSESEGSDRCLETSQSSTKWESKLRAKERILARKEAELAEREARLATSYERETYPAGPADMSEVRRHASSQRKYRGQALSPSEREPLPLRRNTFASEGQRRGTTHSEAYIQE